MEFHASLSQMARYLHRHPPVMEWKQLSTQGVARYLGSLKTIQVFRAGVLVSENTPGKNTRKSEAKAPAASRRTLHRMSTRDLLRQALALRRRLFQLTIISRSERESRRGSAQTSLQRRRVKQGQAEVLRRDMEPLPNRRGEKEMWSLGLTRRQYCATPGDASVISPFLRACEEQAEEWQLCLQETDLLTAVDKINALIAKIYERSCKEMQKWLRTGYVHKSIVRKIAMSMIAYGDTAADWSVVTVADLANHFPDTRKLLRQFPLSWSAADMSNFLFDRPDLAMYASCYACLWHDVREHHDTQLIMEAIVSGRMERQARQILETTGNCGVPAWIVECMNL